MNKDWAEGGEAGDYNVVCRFADRPDCPDYGCVWLMLGSAFVDGGYGTVLFEEWLASVEKRMLRRAQLAMNPLLSVSAPDPYMIVGLGKTHMMPCKNVAVSAIFVDTLTFNFHTIGRGMTSMTAPVTAFGIAIYRIQAISSIQVPTLSDLSHANDWGKHCKIAMNVLDTPVALITSPTR